MNNNLCNFKVKNNNCKFKYTKLYNNLYYCTRHYNQMQKNNKSEETKVESEEAKVESEETKVELEETKVESEETKVESEEDFSEEEIKFEDETKTESLNLLNIIQNIKELSNYSNIIYINSIDMIELYIIEIENKKYYLKYQNLNDIKNILLYEFILLTKYLNNDYIIKIINKYYKYNEYIIILYEFIENDYLKIKQNIDIEEIKIKNIGINLINAIKEIHNKKYLYLDLNPKNIKFENTNKLKLINFNLCNKYIDNYSRYYTNEKLSISNRNNYYGSRNINLKYRGVRIDDIESILYILLDLLDIEDFQIIKTMNLKSKILNQKKKIFNQKYFYDFINKFIEEINIYVTNEEINSKLQNKAINYNKFIEILK